MNYYLRHLGDYAKSTGALTQGQHGALSLLLDWYYAMEKPIPADMAYSIARCVSREEKRAAEFVLKHYFAWDIDAQGWRNGRADAEIAKASEKREKARASVQKRWQKVQPRDDANAMRTHYERNTNVSQTYDERTTNAILSNTPLLQDSNTPLRRMPESAAASNGSPASIGNLLSKNGWARKPS